MKEEKNYVYILLSKDKKMFKVGRTKNLKQRYHSLKCFWGNFNLDKSYAIECNSDFAYKLEGILKHLFIDYRISFLEEDKSEGWTEFFEIKAYSKMKKFINDFLFCSKKDLKYIDVKKFLLEEKIREKE